MRCGGGFYLPWNECIKYVCGGKSVSQVPPGREECHSRQAIKLQAIEKHACPVLCVMSCVVTAPDSPRRLSPGVSSDPHPCAHAIIIHCILDSTCLLWLSRLSPHAGRPHPLAMGCPAEPPPLRGLPRSPQAADCNPNTRSSPLCSRCSQRLPTGHSFRE